MKIVFAGTPEFALPCLDAIAASDHQLTGVFTQPDRAAGRGRRLAASPVKTRALELGVPIEQPEKLKQNPAALAALEAMAPDMLVVVAYGLLLPPAVLDLPRLGAINVHASLLPRWRGAAPIARAIQAGDRQTGVTIMQMARGLDTGPMLETRRLPIADDATAGDLHDRLAVMGAEALIGVLGRLPDRVQPIEQDDAQATYARMLDKAEAVIDWNSDALDVARAVRAFAPWPVAHTGFDGGALRIWRALALDTDCDAPPGTVIAAGREGIDVACGAGVLRILDLQLPGKRRVAAADAANGREWAGLHLG